MKVGNPLKGLGIFGDLIFILQRIVVDGNGNIYTHVVFYFYSFYVVMRRSCCLIGRVTRAGADDHIFLDETPRSRTHVQDTEDPRPIDYYSSPSCALLISHPS